MGTIYDTCVLINYERLGTEIENLVPAKEYAPAGVSVVSIAELLHGAHRADGEERKQERLAFVEKVCTIFTVFDYDMAAARTFAEIWSSAAQRGISVGVNDMIIAATALSRGYSVLTLNGKDFENIEGLSVRILDGDKKHEGVFTHD
jgi:tRNA(fMet)-specific endonuclease VapC